MAVGWARRHRGFITFENVDLYRTLIVEGAWWDLVDEVAAHLVGPLTLGFPTEMAPVLEGWLTSDDMWLQRTVIICQLGAKDATDTDLLFDSCRRMAHSPEFFIRKAVGWALRQYSKTDPSAVAEFVDQNRHALSGLSIREASKYL